MSKIKNINRYRFIASILVTALILSSLLFFPSSVFTANLTGYQLSNQSGTDVGVPFYYIGSTVNYSTSYSFSTGDNIPINDVTFEVTGPQSITKSGIPFNNGATFSQNLPDSTDPLLRGTLSGSVTWDNVGYSGTGYGYGSGSGASKINFTINWKPPVLLNPQPPAPPPTLPGSTPLLSMPNNAFVRGLGYDSTNNRIYALVDDPTGGPDNILVFDATSGNQVGNPINIMSNGSPLNSYSLEALDF